MKPATLLLAGALALGTAFAQAQPDPSQPIRIYLAGPEGNTEVVLRAFANRLAAALGQRATTENRTGIAGTLAAGNSVARADPDGHTLLIGGPGALAFNPAIAGVPTYDPVLDFAPVALIGSTPFVLAANRSLGVNALGELISLARAQPGKIGFVPTALRSPPHLLGELLKMAAGIELSHSALEGPGGGVGALLAGQGALVFALAPAVVQNSEKLKALAVASSTRLEALPDVPTFAEAGLPAVTGSNWFGVVAPARTPEAIVARLRREVEQMLAGGEMRGHLRGVGLTPAPAGFDFAGYLRDEWSRWTRAAETGRLQAQVAEQVRRRASLAPDLAFQKEARALGRYNDVANQIFKPDGAGPFPAIVLYHTCDGINAVQSGYWTEAALRRGYAVLVLDSFGPRGLRGTCDVPPDRGKNGVDMHRSLKDALDGLEHLSKLAIVDADRIALVGFSWGAMAGLYAASNSLSTALQKRRFRAIASVYPFCGSYLSHDIDRPLLVLMGDADNEAPPEECLRPLGWLRERGAPVEWRLYPGATHAWDWDRAVSFTHRRGMNVHYVPNAAVREESARHLFDFLDRHLGKPSR